MSNEFQDFDVHQSILYFCTQKYNIGHTLKLRQGGLIPEMIQVCDYDILIVLVELNTLI